MSFRRCLDQLPKKSVHGQNPIVTPANKQNLARFEAASRKDEPQRNGTGMYLYERYDFVVLYAKLILHMQEDCNKRSCYRFGI